MGPVEKLKVESTHSLLGCGCVILWSVIYVKSKQTSNFQKGTDQLCSVCIDLYKERNNSSSTSGKGLPLTSYYMSFCVNGGIS